MRLGACGARYDMIFFITLRIFYVKMATSEWKRGLHILSRETTVKKLLAINATQI